MSPNSSTHLQFGHDEGQRCHARERVIRRKNMNQMQLCAELFDQWQGTLNCLKGRFRKISRDQEITDVKESAFGCGFLCVNG